MDLLLLLTIINYCRSNTHYRRPPPPHQIVDIVIKVIVIYRLRQNTGRTSKLSTTEAGVRVIPMAARGNQGFQIVDSNLNIARVWCTFHPPVEDTDLDI